MLKDLIAEFIFVAGEMNLLEAHLAEHSKFGWKMYVCESAVTTSGVPKPLHFQENKKRFEKYNVEHVILPSDCKLFTGNFDTHHVQFRENDRKKLTYIYNNYKDTAWNYYSDVDEILNFEKFDTWRWILEDSDRESICINLDNHIGRVNLRVGRAQDGYRISRSNIEYEKLVSAKLAKKRIAAPGRIGWHFTNCFSSLDELYDKIKCRTWYFGIDDPRNLPPKEEFEHCLHDLIDPITKRPVGGRVVPINVLPQWMQENIHLFPVWTEEDERKKETINV